MKVAGNKEELKLIVEELEKRKSVPFVLEDFCFDKQIEFIEDPKRFKTAVCSRRSGKSVTCGAHLVHQCTKKAGSTCLYITLTRTNAKKLVWREVLEINKKYKLGGVSNNSELTMTFPNGSIIYFSGASKKEELDKYRGLSLDLVYLDEAQSFKPYIAELIDEVLAYAIMDTNGAMCLIGTPGPVPTGYFFNTSHSVGWSNHKWTIFDNPYIKIKSGIEPGELLRQERERRGISENDPAYLREALGQWVQDNDVLVYKYDAARNNYIDLPEKKDLIFVFGVDLGYNDADAIAVLGYSKTQKIVYLVEELITEKQGITELAQQIHGLIKKYEPAKIKIDAGALGKKISEELIRRHQLPVQAAEKNRKLEYIELLNDDLRTGKLRVKNTSTCANDYSMIQWDVMKKEKRTVSDSFHSDIADAVLYAWRECLHFSSESNEKPRYSDKEKVDKFWEDEERKLQEKDDKEWWEQ
jgi:hypothetical protein